MKRQLPPPKCDNRHNFRRITPVLVSGLVAALSVGLGHAQESPSGATDLDRVEVTGSRIRGVQIENQQPVLIVSRETLERQGFTSLADVLQNMTFSGSPAISRSSVLSSGESVGGYYIDVRNLGAVRTLVLLNGKRLGATTSGLQDLSQIPMSAIERVEVLKDGASSIYGSDAIAGVVNVITRRRFDGGEASAYFGEFGDGDGDTRQYALTLGVNGERGSMTLSAEYRKEDPVWAKDRWYSRDGNAGPDYRGSGWSVVSHRGSALLPCGPNGASTWCTLNPGGNPLNVADYHPLISDNGSDRDERANSNEQMMAQTGIERKSVFINAAYDLGRNIELNTDMVYNERSTLQQVAGYPYQSAAFGTPLDADSAFNPRPGNDIQFRRRLWDVPRTTDSILKTLRFAPTISGYFEAAGRTFDWDVSAVFNRNDLSKIGHGDMSLIASRQALGPSFIDADGVARCGTAANPIDGCLAWNPLLPFGVAGPGSLSNPDLQAFLFPFYTDTGETRTNIYSANLAGSLFTLPAGDLGFAVGVEHRKERGRFVPDAMAQSGEYTGLVAGTTQGEYDLDEIYLELNVPLLADMPGAKELSVNLASRYSDYSNFGSTTNNKVGLVWRPMDELLIRGTWAEGFRAPTISDMYGGGSSTFSFYTDPCSTGVPGSVAGNAACTAAGVPANYVQLGQGLVPCTSWPCQTPDQFFSGSNPNLQPETSKGKTAGLVWSPRWVNGLDINLDWYNYKIENLIVSDSIGRILGDCYVRGNAARCEQAGVRRAPDGHITTMFYGRTNRGLFETEGWDLGLRYRLPELSIGQFSVDLQNSYTSKYDTLTLDARDQDAMSGAVGSPGYFRLRTNLGIDWQIKDVRVSWTARYYSGMKESCVAGRPCTDLDHISLHATDPLREVGSNTFHDLQVRLSVPWNASISIGANNVLDHKGPIMFTAPNSQYPYYGGFDIGRFMYMRYTQKF